MRSAARPHNGDKIYSAPLAKMHFHLSPRFTSSHTYHSHAQKKGETIKTETAATYFVRTQGAPHAHALLV